MNTLSYRRLGCLLSLWVLVNSLPCDFKIAIPAESMFSFNILPEVFGDTCLGMVVNRVGLINVLINCLHIVGVLAVVLYVPAYGDS